VKHLATKTSTLCGERGIGAIHRTHEAEDVTCLDCVDLMAREVSRAMGELQPGETRVMDSYLQGDRYIVEMEHLPIKSVDSVVLSFDVGEGAAVHGDKVYCDDGRVIDLSNPPEGV